MREYRLVRRFGIGKEISCQIIPTALRFIYLHFSIHDNTPEIKSLVIYFFIDKIEFRDKELSEMKPYYQL